MTENHKTTCEISRLRAFFGVVLLGKRRGFTCKGRDWVIKSSFSLATRLLYVKIGFQLSRLWFSFLDQNPIETPLIKWFGLLFEVSFTRKESQFFVNWPALGSKLKFCTCTWLLYVAEIRLSAEAGFACLFRTNERPLKPGKRNQQRGSTAPSKRALSGLE